MDVNGYLGEKVDVIIVDFNDESVNFDFDDLVNVYEYF